MLVRLAFYFAMKFNGCLQFSQQLASDFTRAERSQRRALFELGVFRRWFLV